MFAPTKAAFGAALALVFLAPASMAQDMLTRNDVESIVREYILENPELLEEAFQALQQRREQEAEIARAASLDQLRDKLLSFEHDPVIGNPEGEITLVEFFDYNCGFCRQAYEDVLRLVQTNPNLRVVLKEFPVLGAPSMEAAAISIAVNQVAPERYGEFHDRLMKHEGRVDGAAAMDLVQAMDLPVDDILALREGEAVRSTVETSYEIAQALGLSGTPSFVIGDRVEFGAVGIDRLQEGIDNAAGR